MGSASIAVKMTNSNTAANPWNEVCRAAVANELLKKIRTFLDQHVLQFKRIRFGDIYGCGLPVGQQRHPKDKGVGKLTPNDAFKTDHHVKSANVRSWFKNFTIERLS